MTLWSFADAHPFAFTVLALPVVVAGSLGALLLLLCILRWG